jgi:hypothetical protein
MNANTNHDNFEDLRRVSWKSDPKLSYSDWVLNVSYRDAENKRCIDVYHLHRNVVAYGKRKSNTMFRDIMDSELQDVFDSSNKTECELQELINSDKKLKTEDRKFTSLKLQNESQANVVPLVLDFIYYTNETNHRMSADRSCNVFKVAEGLKVRALQSAISEFYDTNLSMTNICEFLKAATNSKADMLLAICKAKIRKMIAIKPDLVESIPPEFLPNSLDVTSHSSPTEISAGRPRSDEIPIRELDVESAK